MRYSLSLQSTETDGAAIHTPHTMAVNHYLPILAHQISPS